MSSSMKPKRPHRFILPLLIILVLAACSQTPTATQPTPTKTPVTATTQAPTQTASPTQQPSAIPTKQPAEETEPTTKVSQTSSPTITPDLRLRPENWQSWPIIPDLSPEMIALYQAGLANGNDAHMFSVIGDCQSSPTYFLSIYDEGRYTLTEDQAYLEETIQWYQGAFSHLSVAVKNGMTAPGALNPLWADPEKCESKETPITCELRLSNPSLVIISLGTNWHPSTPYEKYVDYLTQIVETLLENKVLPVLSTKADNAEGDYNRNLAMAQVAYDYHIPLWNFWAAVEDLPNLGLDKDRENVYLNHTGWEIRNQSALELLDHLRQELNKN